MTRLRALWESMRATYWVVPSAMAFGAILLSVAMIQLDQAAAATLLDRWSWVYTGGPEGARAVLSTIAASMITVAGVTFSITIVALTLASQQFGPRLLRNFLKDFGNQVVLGSFISTFLYCLLVLRTVRGNDDSHFTPHLAVTVGVGLAILSLGVLIFFIHHVATSIQASHVIANVADELEAAIERIFPDDIGEGPAGGGDSPAAAPPEPGADRGAPRTVAATTTGYVQALDSARVLALAREHDLTIRIDAQPGAFVRLGTPLATLWPAPQPPEARDGPVLEAFIIGADRTGSQDAGFFVNQLVELAVRALSPGINDPGTARTCVDRLEQALCHLAGRGIPSPYRYDEEGVLRVVAPPVTFVSLLDLAFEEIGRYGSSSVSVMGRLLEAVRDLAACTHREEDRQALIRHADVLADRARRACPHEPDRSQIDGLHRAALQALRVSGAGRG
ncbi:MAG: DUF2254 domain-containing protein [Acidobacteriota bacterium]